MWLPGQVEKRTCSPQDGAGAAILLDGLLDAEARDADLIRHLRREGAGRA
jgi:hypothetical protein